MSPCIDRVALLSPAYFAPIQWFQKLNRYKLVLIESHDNYVKQTYRNRCIIATEGGMQALTVPVVHAPKGEKGGAGGMGVRVSDHGEWRHLHWNALATAYGDSPFWQYYADDIRSIFEQKGMTLYGFDMDITLKMCALLDIMPNIATTDHYFTAADVASGIHGMPIDDYRDLIRPKHPPIDESFKPTPYYQVFADRHGFLPNLTILDLLLNMGNEALLYL